MKIAREGIPFASASVFLAGACFAGSWLVGTTDGSSELHTAPRAAEVALGLAGWVMAVLSVFVLWFFRNPDPHLPAEEALVVAPGQGEHQFGFQRALYVQMQLSLGNPFNEGLDLRQQFRPWNE